MLVVHVHITVKPECVAPFREATIANARESLKEPGIARFDFMQQSLSQHGCAGPTQGDPPLSNLAGHGCAHDGRTARRPQIHQRPSAR